MPYKDEQKRIEHGREYNKIWYRANKAKVIEKRKKQQLKIKEWYKTYKTTLYCIDCGETHPACLQFHHRNPSEKSFNIADVAGNATSIKALKREIDKCEVLCVNCHAKRHWKERQEPNTVEQGARGKTKSR